MKNFVVYDESGKILRTGSCGDKDFYRQCHVDEYIMEGQADDIKQKIVDDEVVNKTPEELETEKLPIVPKSECLACITNKQWQAVLDRITTLEKRHG